LLIDLAKLLALFAAIAGALWPLRFVLARVTGHLVPRLVESREVIDGELMAESPLYARVTRSWGFLAVLLALAGLAIWWVGETRRGIIGGAILAGLWVLNRAQPGSLARNVVIVRGVVAFGVLGYAAWLFLGR